MTLGGEYGYSDGTSIENLYWAPDQDELISGFIIISIIAILFLSGNIS